MILIGIKSFSNTVYGITNWCTTSEHQFCDIKNFISFELVNLSQRNNSNTEKVMHMQIKMFTAELFTNMKN